LFLDAILSEIIKLDTNHRQDPPRAGQPQARCHPKKGLKMKNFFGWLALLVSCFLSTACSSTTVIRSWKSADFTEPINKPYIIGISKDDIKRRVFEDRFREALSKYGVNGIVSYKDLSASRETDKKMIAQKVASNGADSVLMVRVINERTEQVVVPGKATTTVSGPIYSNNYERNRDYTPEDHYHDYGNYYARSYETVYEPPSVSNYQVDTIEANLYEAKTSKMIWSAQLELTDNASFDSLLQDFLDTTIQDMRGKGLF